MIYSTCQPMHAGRALLADHVVGYSRRAEAVLGALWERRPRADWCGVRRALLQWGGHLPLACLLLLAGRCGRPLPDSGWLDQPVVRVSGFATETECWTAFPAPRATPEPVRPVANGTVLEEEAVVGVLKGIFSQEGVPPALVWIAEVESAFNPDARSHAGAVGLFQLMPATAQRYGLRTGRVDDRRDPSTSARAAARYLRHLHGRFGNWPLAVAAYNAGEERVAVVLRARKASTFSEIAAFLPPETRSYVPRVLNIVEAREAVNPARLSSTG